MGQNSGLVNKSNGAVEKKSCLSPPFAYPTGGFDIAKCYGVICGHHAPLSNHTPPLSSPPPFFFSRGLEWHTSEAQ